MSKITVKEAANKYNVSVTTIRDVIEKGGIVVYTDKGNWLISAKHLDTYVKKNPFRVKAANKQRAKFSDDPRMSIYVKEDLAQHLANATDQSKASYIHNSCTLVDWIALNYCPHDCCVKHYQKRKLKKCRECWQGVKDSSE